MTTAPIGRPCARNLPQHFNGCACAPALGTTAEASVDLALVEAPEAPAPRVVSVIASELQPGQHVIRGNRVQPVTAAPEPLRYGTIAVPLKADDPFTPAEFRINGREQVAVFLDAGDYDREFVLGNDLAVGDTVVAMGFVQTITAREEHAHGILNFRTTRGDLRFTDVRAADPEHGVTRITRRTHTTSGIPMDSPAAQAPFYATKTPGSWFTDPEHADEHGMVSPDGGYAAVYPAITEEPRDTYADDDRQWAAEGYRADGTYFEHTLDSRDEARTAAEEILFARRA